jgi:hypothetical protein
MAVVRGVVLQACRVLPKDSIVVVESSADAGRTVNIRCENQEMWIFTVDLDERGSLVPAGGETPNRTVEAAYAIAPRPGIDSRWSWMRVRPWLAIPGWIYFFLAALNLMLGLLPSKDPNMYIARASDKAFKRSSTPL